MNMDFTEKLNELLADERFVKDVCTAENTEAVKALFKSKNVALDDEAAKELYAKVHSDAGEELDEDALENVNGGGLGAALGFCALSTVGAWAVVGIAAGVVLGVLLVKAYTFFKYGK